MKIKKIAFLLTVFCSVFASVSANAYFERKTAIVNVMSKAAGKVHSVNLPIGQEVKFEKLKLIARTCKQTDPFDAENFFIFVQISKSDDSQIFSGWMNRNEPGDNPLQDPDYDVWLVGCE